MVKLLEPELAPILNGASVLTRQLKPHASNCSRTTPILDGASGRTCFGNRDYNGAYAVAARYHTLQEDGDFAVVEWCSAAAKRDQAGSIQAAIRLQPERMMLTIILVIYISLRIGL